MNEDAPYGDRFQHILATDCKAQIKRAFDLHEVAIATLEKEIEVLGAELEEARAEIKDLEAA